MMTGNTSNKLFTAKDILKYLGINANTLYHWVQVRGLIKPAIEGRGRGRAHKFDMENMATILLTKFLHGFSLELRVIKDLYDLILDPDFSVKPNISVKEAKEFKKMNIWKIYKSNPIEHDRLGYYLFVQITFKGGIGIGVDSYYGIITFLDEIRKRKKDFKNTVSLIVVDLVSIVNNLEETLGLKF